ncbi:hypothetical protein pEaSNUABM11_00161 [Erwinia phage pEa_SNUABM_11]|nr:hypothetical protein pEaSNUABM11_00161 [Erwinia phage pEa_SNUABM_11]
MAEQSVVVNKGKVLVNQDGNVVEIDIALLMQKLEMAGEDALGMIGRCESIDNLRKIEPTKPGQRIDVKGYVAGSRYGGGHFIYDETDKTSAEDRGMVIVTAKGARWKRDIPHIGALIIDHFGGIPDGKTDNLIAFTRMMKWSKANLRQLGVQFGAGTYFISQYVDNTAESPMFRISGFNSSNAFGYCSTTTIVSNDDANVLFDIKARWSEVSGILFDGKITNDDKTVRCSQKAFFRNVDPGGQYIRVSNFKANYAGGRVFDMLDTLDTKFDQFYASQCTGTFLYGRWSGQEKGVWNHLTAMELSNFNMQNCTQNLVFDVPRCTQAFIYNGWIEHCEFPGNLSDGGWIIDGLSMEDCKNPMQIQNARLVRKQTNLQSGSGWDANSGGTEWTNISSYEYGVVDIHNTGIKLDLGSIQTGYYGSLTKMDNNTTSAQWFKAAYVSSTSIGETINLRFFGSNAYNSSKVDNQTIASSGQSGGYADLFLKVLNSSTIDAQWDGVGSCPVLDIRIDKDAKGGTNVYVKIAAWSRFVTCECFTNSKTHFEAGVSFRIIREGSKIAEPTDDTTKLVSTGLTFGVKNGLGWNANGELLLKFELQSGYLPVKIQSPSTGKVTQGYIKVETSLPK